MFTVLQGRWKAESSGKTLDRSGGATFPAITPVWRQTYPTYGSIEDFKIVHFVMRDCNAQEDIFLYFFILKVNCNPHPPTRFVNICLWNSTEQIKIIQCVLFGFWESSFPAFNAVVTACGIPGMAAPSWPPFCDTAAQTGAWRHPPKWLGLCRIHLSCKPRINSSTFPFPN